MPYDLLVVGAGPAGSMVAQIVAKDNYKVLLIDKKSVIGEPVQCAEYVPALLSKEISIPAECIANEIKSLVLHAPNKKIYQFSAPGYILNRLLFDKWLAINAIKNGAELWLNTKFIKFTDGYAILQRQNTTVKIKAKIIVGADGPSSAVRKAINEKNEDYVIAYQQEFPLVNAMDYTDVYFDKRFFGGYAWLFPKRHSANVGLGIKLKSKSGSEVKKVFAFFVKNLIKEKKIFSHPITTTNGLIPVGGPIKSVKKNIILVGDAAGQTHPITGAGISQAIICGKLAAQAIIKTLKSKDANDLSYYESAWNNLYYDELKRAVQRRKLMESEWNNLEKIFKKCWVSFAEYYE